MKYTVIHLASVGYRLGQYFPVMKRIRTKNLLAYIQKHDLEPVFIFEGWPKLEGEKK